jgi:hypothetical protein
MTQPLDLDQILGRAKTRQAAFTRWLNSYSPQPSQEVLDQTEAVLKEDVDAMAAEIRRLRAELAAEQAQHAFTLRQRNNRSKRLLHLRDLANTGDTVQLIAAAKDTLAASVNDHKEQQ